MTEDLPSVVRSIFGSGVPSDEHNKRAHDATVELAEQRARRAKIVTDFIAGMLGLLSLAVGAGAFLGFVVLVRSLFF